MLSLTAQQSQVWDTVSGFLPYHGAGLGPDLPWDVGELPQVGQSQSSFIGSGCPGPASGRGHVCAKHLFPILRIRDPACGLLSFTVGSALLCCQPFPYIVANPGFKDPRRDNRVQMSFWSLFLRQSWIICYELWFQLCLEIYWNSYSEKTIPKRYFGVGAHILA